MITQFWINTDIGWQKSMLEIFTAHERYGLTTIMGPEDVAFLALNVLLHARDGLTHAG